MSSHDESEVPESGSCGDEVENDLVADDDGHPDHSAKRQRAECEPTARRRQSLHVKDQKGAALQTSIFNRSSPSGPMRLLCRS